MSRFRFALEPVLRLRRHRLECARVSLAEAQQRRLDLEQLEGEARRGLVTLAQGVSHRTSQGVMGSELAVWSEQSDQLMIQARQREAGSIQARDVAEQVAGRVRAAHADVRALEILRERRRAAHKIRARRREDRIQLERVAAAKVRTREGGR